MKDKGEGALCLRVIIQHLYMSRYSNTGIINVELKVNIFTYISILIPVL